MGLVNALNEAGFLVNDPGDNGRRICIEAVTTTRVLA
jgi:hypothetical protein